MQISLRVVFLCRQNNVDFLLTRGSRRVREETKHNASDESASCQTDVVTGQWRDIGIDFNFDSYQMLLAAFQVLIMVDLMHLYKGYATKESYITFCRSFVILFRITMDMQSLVWLLVENVSLVIQLASESYFCRTSRVM